jgi:hypothetical protein
MRTWLRSDKRQVIALAALVCLWIAAKVLW